MRKICFLLLTLMFVIIGAESGAAATNIGIVIIGDDEFKSEVYFKRSAEIFTKDKKLNAKVESGETLQNKYSSYCKDKDISDSDAPTLDNLLEFTAQNNFDKVLCLVIKNPEVSEHAEYEYGGMYFGSVLENKLTVTMTVNAYFCNQDKLLKTVSVTKEKTQYAGRSPESQTKKAARGAFTLCIKDIGKAIKDL